MTRPLLIAVALLAGCSKSTPAPASASQRAAEKPTQPHLRPEELSEVLRVKRPPEGEYFGLYMMGKKVGYQFSDFKLLADGRRAEARSEVYFKAGVGSKVSERTIRDVRVFDARPQGRLLSFVIEQAGDGGNQRLEGTATADGLRVLRKRPGLPDEVLNLPATEETVEDADQIRLAIHRKATVSGTMPHEIDLQPHRRTTTFEGPAQRQVGGVRVNVLKTTSVSDRDKVPADVYVDESGRVVEVVFAGGTLRQWAEPEATAKRLDKIEIFGLTRVVLPTEPPPSARRTPGKLTLVVEGMPEHFARDNHRQRFRKLGADKVELTVTAAAPTGKLPPRPLADPAGGENLKSTIVVEAENPAIVDLAQSLVKDEPTAYGAAKRITQWVHQNLKKEYGASADRATDVLKQRRGDCTEHALLSVALLRAAGIPARRADGLVYMVTDDRVPALYWHEWVEAYVGAWTHLDPTFGQDVADATHLAFGEEANAEIAPLIGQLKVIELR